MTFFAVFDGHGIGGERISQHVASNLCDSVLQRMMAVSWSNDNVLIARVIQNAFLELDQDIRHEQSLMNERGKVKGGSTACGIWAKRNLLYVAHVGDTRAILSAGGFTHQITIDHLPQVQAEAKRIYASGGYVERGRILGALGVSRAFGNFQFKRNLELSDRMQMVTSCPDVRIVDLKKDLKGHELDFIVIASDGVFEVLTNEELADMVRCEINETGAMMLDDLATANP